MGALEEPACKVVRGQLPDVETEIEAAVEERRRRGRDGGGPLDVGVEPGPPELTVGTGSVSQGLGRFTDVHLVVSLSSHCTWPFLPVAGGREGGFESRVLSSVTEQGLGPFLCLLGSGL